MSNDEILPVKGESPLPVEGESPFAVQRATAEQAAAALHLAQQISSDRQAITALLDLVVARAYERVRAQLGDLVQQSMDAAKAMVEEANLHDLGLPRPAIGVAEAQLARCQAAVAALSDELAQLDALRARLHAHMAELEATAGAAPRKEHEDA